MVNLYARHDKAGFYRLFRIRYIPVALWMGLVLSALLLLSSSIHAHGTFHERIGRVDRQIEQDPQNAELYLTRAGIYRNNGDWGAALADIDRAAQLDPGRREVDYFRGRVFLAAGLPEKAEATLRRFLVTAPDHPAARVARARALAKLGRHLEAADDFTRAIRYAPVPIPEYYLERAQALVLAGEEHRGEAIRGLDEGMVQLGPLMTLVLVAIELEVERGHFDTALARLERLAAHVPRQEWWLARRGDILERAGRKQAARDSFQLALAEIGRLPSHRRKTQGIVRLEARVREALEQLSTSAP
ncbi:tetratricopeptide repeat protein [Nitrospiraceae bacterium AH_259_D15_M11_P09]|nr:tetratricopeptide repeat protein [Nitrospiraceae bacterium AH_259_D15_M11_P09]